MFECNYTADLQPSKRSRFIPGRISLFSIDFLTQQPLAYIICEKFLFTHICFE